MIEEEEEEIEVDKNWNGIILWIVIMLSNNVQGGDSDIDEIPILE